MPKAFLTEPARHDTSPAERFGEVVVLYPQKRPSVWAKDYTDLLLDELEQHEFNPETDYLVVSGPVIAVALLVSAVAATYGWVNLLLYDTREQEYVERAVRCDPTLQNSMTPSTHSTVSRR